MLPDQHPFVIIEEEKVDMEEYEMPDYIDLYVYYIGNLSSFANNCTLKFGQQASIYCENRRNRLYQMCNMPFNDFIGSQDEFKFRDFNLAMNFQGTPEIAQFMDYISFIDPKNGLFTETYYNKYQRDYDNLTIYFDQK